MDQETGAFVRSFLLLPCFRCLVDRVLCWLWKSDKFCSRWPRLAQVVFALSIYTGFLDSHRYMGRCGQRGEWHGLRGLTQPLECKHARNPTLSTSGCTCLSSQLHTDALLWPSVVTSAQPLNSTSPSLHFLMSSVWVGLFSMRFPVWKVTFSQTGPVKLGISCSICFRSLSRALKHSRFIYFFASQWWPGFLPSQLPYQDDGPVLLSPLTLLLGVALW